MTSYAYDALSRLQSLTHDFAGTANDLTIGGMSYNPAGQITSQTRSNDAYAWTGHANVNRGYTSNGLNQYTNVAGAAQGYDGRGNLILTQATNPATMQTVQNDYTFTSDNLLKTKTEPNNSGATVSLHYDPAGRLVEYNTNVSRRFQYDGAEVSTELAGSTITGRYVRGDGADEVLVWYIGSGTSDRRWLHADERGSIVAVSDGAGSVNINRYDEYGAPQSGTGTFRYTGQMWLPELGVYYYKARMYSPPWGRFLQTDPIGYGDSMNMYAYVGNDPVNMVDPSGMTSCPQGHVPAEEVGGPIAGTCVPGDPIIVTGDRDWRDWLLLSWTPDHTILDFDDLATGAASGGTSGGSGGGGGGGGGGMGTPCADALKVARKDASGVARARAAWGSISAAASRHSIDPRLLAAIGVRETNFQNVKERGGGAGMGVFQLTNQPGVTAAQAFNVAWSANYAAQMLRSNMSRLDRAFPSFSPSELLQATAASYNFGSGNISGNPATIDVGTAHNNYGSNVVNLMKCF